MYDQEISYISDHLIQRAGIAQSV